MFAAKIAIPSPASLISEAGRWEQIPLAVASFVAEAACGAMPLRPCQSRNPYHLCPQSGSRGAKGFGELSSTSSSALVCLVSQRFFLL